MLLEAFKSMWKSGINLFLAFLEEVLPPSRGGLSDLRPDAFSIYQYSYLRSIIFKAWYLRI
jgi:hypothetical protein